MWSLIFRSVTVQKFTAGDIDRAVAFADGFISRHAMMIPVSVHSAWAGLRGALLTWKDDLAAEERRRP